MSLKSISMGRLIANDYADNAKALQKEYGRILERKLKNHLNEQAVMAGALGSSVSVSVGQKEGWINKALSYFAGSFILRILVAVFLGALITAALTLFPFIALTAPAVIALIGTAIATGLFSVLTSLSKNRAKISAKAFMVHKPSDDMLTMVSDLVVLFNAEKFKSISDEPKENSLWYMIKEAFYHIQRRLAGVKTPRAKQDREIKKFLKKEADKIWKIFETCTHDPEKFDAYKSSSLAQEILGFFKSRIELGEPGKEKSRQLETNELWLTVFSQYLNENDLGLTESDILKKLNTIFSHEVDAERLKMHHAQESCSVDALNERVQRLEGKLDALEAELADKSSLIDQLQEEVQHLKEGQESPQARQKTHRLPLRRSASSASFFQETNEREETIVSPTIPILQRG